MAPPVRTDDQILPHIRWVSIGKSNCYLDVEKSQSNPIYKIAIDILKHTNFFRAFTASCQLDEQWFDLTKDTLKDALQITPVNDNQAFTSPSSSDVLIKFVNELGYPKLVRNLSNVGVVTQTHIDYAERIWEEFTQSIHTFIDDKRNLAQHTSGKKKATLIVILSIRFTKLIIYHLQKKHKFHPRPDSPIHLPNKEPVLGYLKFSAKYLAGETGSDPDSPASKPAKIAKKPKPTAPKAYPRPSVSKPISSTQAKPKSAPAKTQGKKRKLTTKTSDKPSKAIKSRHGFSTPKSVDKSVAEDVPTKELRVNEEEADVQRALEESMKSMYDVTRGPLPPIVIREPESGKYQLLLKVPGKGKAKVTEEPVSHDLLNLQKPKKKSPTNQYIFQIRTSTPTESSGHDESSSLYIELRLTNSKEETEEVVHGDDAGGQGEGQAGPDPGAQDEGQARSKPDEQAKSKGQAGPDP
nr:histone deacetylase 14 [Tanacetum cinerariifolium]